MFDGVRYSAQVPRKARVYFTGTETLVQGQPLCYQEDPDTAASTKGLGLDVEIPNSDNRSVFAGIVADNYIGFTGPGWIDIVIPQPGDILQVLVSDHATIGKGDVVRLDEDVPTVATNVGGPKLGGFIKVAIASSSSFGTAQTQAVIDADKMARAQMLASQASTNSANQGRQLAWVQFK